MKNKILYGISTAIWFIATILFAYVSFKTAKGGAAGVLPFIMMVILFAIVFIVVFVINLFVLIANKAGKDFKKDAIFWLEVLNLLLPFASMFAGILIYMAVA